jgi:L-ascorbate metabolism protein UlaG (beta-lactamase superfamily)
MAGPAAAPEVPFTEARPRLELRFFGHATVLLELAGTRVLTDPFLRAGLGPLQRHGPLPRPGDLEGIDVIVISHGHADHFDPMSLAVIRGRPVVVVPRGLGAATRQATGGQVVEVIEGEQLTVGPLSITALPARHWISPGAPRAQPLGYLIEGGQSVWFAGDTGYFDGIRALAGRVDVALLPVWTWGPHLGPGHLGPRAAAEILREIGPSAAVPIHWGTLYPHRLHRLWPGPLAEPGERFASHAMRLAPTVDVRVLRPGEATSIVATAGGRDRS